VVLTVCSKPPFNVTVYSTSQSDVDAVQDTVAVVWVAAPATLVGVVGGSHVVEKVPVVGLLDPAALVAVTLTVYSVPGVRPVYDALLPVTVWELPPLSVTVYVKSQSDVDASQLTVAVVAVILLAETSPGGVGSVHVVVNDKDPVPALIVPPAETATTEIEYEVPASKVVYDTLVLLVVCSYPPFNLTLYVTGHADVTAVHETVADACATLLAATPVGAGGTGHASVVSCPVPALLSPPSFVATTLMV